MANNVKYRSGNFTTATQIGAYRDEEPLLPDYNGVLVRRADFMQLWSSFVALDLNTVLADDTRFKLVDESPHEDVGGGHVKWTRTWARIPNTHYKPGGVYYYSFPGLDLVRDVTAQMPVWAKIKREFYLVGPGGTYATFEALVAAKLVRAQQYYLTNKGPSAILSGDSGSALDYVLRPSTTPTDSDWATFIANNDVIVAEDSKIDRWMGNIFFVNTIYIPAR
jgi:hypothetical protein